VIELNGEAFEGAAISHTVTDANDAPVLDGLCRVVSPTLTGAPANVVLRDGQSSPAGWTTRTMSWLSAWELEARTENAYR